MRPYQTSATVDPSGSIRVNNVPYEVGAQVEVLILPRRDRVDIAQRIQALFRETQALPQVQALTDEEIEEEIDAHRRHR